MKDKKNKKNKKNRFNVALSGKNNIPVTDVYISELRRKAEYYYEEKNFEEALSYYLTLMKYENDFNEYDIVGFCYYETCDYENALIIFFNEYENFCNEYKENISDDVFSKKDIIFSYICKSYLKIEDFNECIDFCSDISSENKLYARKLQFLIQSYSGLNDDEKFKEYFNIFNEKYPNDEIYKLEMFKYAFEIKSFHRFELFENLNNIQIKPYLFMTFLNSCDDISVIKKINYYEFFIKAITSNDYIIKDYSGDDDEVFEIISDKFMDLLYEIHDYEKILNYLEIFDKIIKKNEIHATISYNLLILTLVSVNTNKLYQTEQIINKYLNEDETKYSRLYFLLAIIYYFKKEYTTSIEYCEKAFNSVGYKSDYEDIDYDEDIDEISFKNWLLGVDNLAEFVMVLIIIKKENNLIDFKEKMENLLIEEKELSRTSDFSVILNKLLTYIYSLTKDSEKIKECELFEKDVKEKNGDEFDDFLSCSVYEEIIDKSLIYCAKYSDFMIF